MNYEEKYNEILEWARKNKARLNGVPIEEVLPELAESEDERIRKALIEVFKKKLERGFEWVEYGIPNRSVLAWLEKQKENPKSTDSISSDCTSDVKCEDRWYKVGDFLPDNGRLVLANDCLGNTLLARYDGEGNWEVSVYDNEDYYCRNTITKWCEIPSERQKPVDYDHEMWKNCEANFEGGKKEVIEHPEKYGLQKPAEWSDTKELVFKDICNHLEVEGYSGWVLLLNALRNGEFQPKQEWSEEDIKKIRSEEYTKGFNDAAFGGKLKEWSVEDEDRIRQIERIAQEAGCTQKLQEEIHDWLKSLRKQAKPEWSEEDEEMLQSIIKDFRAGKISTIGQEQWLKSLRPSWKPSEEQMKALLNTLHPDDPYYHDLKSLYEQLKKL